MEETVETMKNTSINTFKQIRGKLPASIVNKLVSIKLQTIKDTWPDVPEKDQLINRWLQMLKSC